jgi:hypothetical protein
MSDNVFPTICPGCNFGCGLYIRENGALEVDFRKSSPANAGKLCRFGMKLPSLFTSVKSMIDGSEAQAQDAAKEAASRLSSGSTAFVSFGNTSSEEHLAFQKFSEKLKVPLYTGVDFDGLPEDTHPTLRVGIPYSEIEAAKHIVLFIDPYTQYPLIVRRLVSAKKRGAKITAVGYKELPIADDNISPDDISQLALTGDSVVIADFHPLSDTGHLKSVLALAGNAGAKLTFLKPFGNSTGAYLVSKDVKQQALSKLVEEIDKGSIDTLFCLESDVLEVIPAEVAGKLKNLIIQTGHNSATAQKANIVIASEPFYRKKGMVVNNEGRVQALGGGEVSGIALLGTIAGDSYDFDGLNGEVKSMLGIESVDEFTVPAYERPAYAAPEVTEPVNAGETTLVTDYTPFTWSGLADDNDFVELNLGMVRALKLLKGGKVRISSNGASVEKRFKVGPVLDNIVITEKSMPFVKGGVAAVEVSR